MFLSAQIITDKKAQNWYPGNSHFI